MLHLSIGDQVELKYV